MKSAGRLALQAAYARSVCVAYASFWITDVTEMIFSQSREVKKITRYGAGLYGLELVHPMTFAKHIPVPPSPPYDGYTVDLYSHYRIHVEHMSDVNPSSPVISQSIGLNAPDPANPLAPRNSCMIVLNEFIEGTTDPLLLPYFTFADAPVQVSIFDCLTPDARQVESQMQTLSKTSLSRIAAKAPCKTILSRFGVKIP